MSKFIHHLRYLFVAFLLLTWCANAPAQEPSIPLPPIPGVLPPDPPDPDTLPPPAQQAWESLVPKGADDVGGGVVALVPPEEKETPIADPPPPTTEIPLPPPD